jgi:4-amino-4-deoxy-L-arabinose transferase-like glycosyltransferase
MTTVSHPSAGPAASPTGFLPRVGGAVRGLVRGRLADAAWVRPAQLGVTGLAALLYLVNLTVSGFANTYYSAAALAAAQSWSAWFFGSIDSANFITVDKPPLSTMLMGLSVRLFGLESWAILLPEALAGVATVAVLFVIVRRSFGPAAAVIAGLVMALTPAAVLIFRYNNPDALLTLLLVLAAGAFLRAVEAGRIRWVVLAAVLVGLAFNTKYLQAYLVLPAFALTYLIAAPIGLRRRVAGLAVAAATVLVASGWWVLAVELIPAASRPYIGGSDTNSAVELLFGYDGLARIFGFLGGGPGGAAAGAGAAVAGGGGGGFSGTAGLLRLFNAELGGQIAWLLPFSLVGLIGGLWARRRTPRTDPARAAYLMWGLWLLVHAIVFSFMTGIIHSYYVVAMAPAVAALVGAGTVELWSLRSRVRFGGLALGATILGSAVMAWWLLDRTPDFAPGLGVVILIVGALVALVVAVPAAPHRQRTQFAAAALGLAVLLAGPAAYALDTMSSAYGGGDPSAGPATATRSGPSGTFAGGPPTDGQGFASGPGRGTPPGGTTLLGAGGSSGRAAAGPGAGGADASDPALVAYLLANRGAATWIVATWSANGAGSIELASLAPVMAMGGFSGGDPTPTLDQLKAYVASGQLRYVLLGTGGGGPGGGSSTAIGAWVTSVGTVVDYGGSAGTLYDLSGATTADVSATGG